MNKRKNTKSQQNLAVFLAATDSENIIIQILHGNGLIKIWPESPLLGQEPTFNSIKMFHARDDSSHYCF